jgi:hypothetical protein
VAFVLRPDGLGVFGEGVYLGEFYAPIEIVQGTPYTEGAEPCNTSTFVGARRIPCLRLTNGDYIWGCECLWIEIDRWDAIAAKSPALIPMTVSDIRTRSQVLSPNS